LRVGPAVKEATDLSVRGKRERKTNMTNKNAAILKVSDLNVTIDDQHIIEDLSFTVMRGDILTILGPNGAGKTVLLRTLLGVMPHEGSITWEQGVRIGYVPQRLPYIKDVPMSVKDFFGLKGTLEAGARDILRAVGLSSDFTARSMGALSSGQYQRVLIAWGLIGDPQVLLFDEPTTGVDISGEETVYNLLERLHREKNLTMLLVTHDLAVVYKFSSNVLCMNKQRVCYGPPRAVLTPESLQRLYGTEVKYYHHTHE
jgi:zinc transport system ATP-binding protein